MILNEPCMDGSERNEQVNSKFIQNRIFFFQSFEQCSNGGGASAGCRFELLGKREPHLTGVGQTSWVTEV